MSLWFLFFFFLLASLYNFPRLASKHEQKIDVLPVPWKDFMFSVRLFSPLLSHAFTHLADSSDLCLSFFFVIAALQTWPVYSQRAWCYTRGRGVGSLESFWYLFTNMWWGHQDRCAWMQPTRVSSSSLCSHARLVDLVSISVGKVSVP